MGGDEFVIILSRVNGSDNVAHVAQKIIDNFIAPFEIQGQEIFITTSIGIALFPDDGDNPATLLKNADIAMYQAKQNGRDNFQFFTAEMNLLTHERLSIESSLRYALSRDEFLLYLQPWQDLGTGEITGVEALIRWAHPSEGMIPPMRFIPIAEDCGLIVPIGEWALKNACIQVKTLQEAGFPHLKVAVNLSGRQFKGTNLAVIVAKVLQETGFDPACLELEITESIVMADTKETQVVLRQLQEMGVSLSVDDFGTGYSSLGYLKRLPIAKLKIDQSFISDLCNSADNAAITRAIISMAKSLNLKVTAEGVEQKDQLELLRQLGCDMVQGYIICKPMPLNDLLEHLRATKGY
jgi:predicted signal transduction protein with EAL and GGDEF domain